jgi:hypothetical protein
MVTIQPAERGMAPHRALIFSILISASASLECRAGAGAGLHPPGPRCRLRRRPARRARRRYDHLGRRHPLEPDLAASQRHHRQQIVDRGRPGVFVGKGKGVVPRENPGAPNKARCAVLDGVSYCY